MTEQPTLVDDLPSAPRRPGRLEAAILRSASERGEQPDERMVLAARRADEERRQARAQQFSAADLAERVVRAREHFAARTGR